MTRPLSRVLFAMLFALSLLSASRQRAPRASHSSDARTA